MATYSSLVIVTVSSKKLKSPTTMTLKLKAPSCLWEIPTKIKLNSKHPRVLCIYLLRGMVVRFWLEQAYRMLKAYFHFLTRSSLSRYPWKTWTSKEVNCLLNCGSEIIKRGRACTFDCGINSQMNKGRKLWTGTTVKIGWLLVPLIGWVCGRNQISSKLLVETHMDRRHWCTK